MTFFTAENITAGYDRKTIIENISFRMETGTVVGIIGANGCGKTTLLKALCGILPHTGICTIEGTTLEKLSLKQLAGLCGYIPQRSGITIDLPVMDVVLMGFNPHLGILAHPTQEMRKTASDALCKVGLSDRADMNYQKLSEGQKQLVILARTIVSGSKLLILDEPESALDFRHRHNVMHLIRSHIESVNGGAIISLHDPSLALNFCDYLLLIDEGKTAGFVSPKNDPLDKTEQLLSKIYGKISLHVCQNAGGREQIVMLQG
ncbi:MAG: ABC transporter ATP-binding protein [Ruminococcaceae bacterium]|nr:ABC transporter ATP-binding protein [Oscillospiraceae bacterium]